MSAATLVTLCCAGIVAILAWRAVHAVRSEDASRRGSAPGEGFHEITSDYQSGVGGGNARTYKVPRDPQAYARHLVPLKARESDPSDDG
ncbi:MAG: hypothetical protein ACU0CO_16635 [Shimia sp.]